MRKKRVLIISSLPAEGGGRGAGGLALSPWLAIRRMDPGNLDIRLLAENVPLKPLKIGKIPTYFFRPWHALSALPACPEIIHRTVREPFLRDNTITIGRTFWFASAIRSFRPDLVHVHGIQRAVQVLPLVSAERLLVTLHGWVGRAEDNYYPFRAEVERLCLERSQNLVTVTERTFQRLLGMERFHGERWVIPNGVDLSRFRPEPQCPLSENVPIRLLTVGNVGKQKNQLAVVEGIARSGFKERFAYRTVGRGALSDAVARRAAERGVAYENIPYLPQTELPEQYHWSDFQILASTAEGFGMVLAESLACGRPLILPESLDIVGEKDIIRPGNAVLLPSADPDHIADTLAGIAKNEILIDSEALNYPYDWTDIAARYVELYEERIASLRV